MLFGPGDIRVVDRPVPRPAPDEVLVRVAMCGMCGTDLKIFGGHFPLTPPFGDYTPGHEWTGRWPRGGRGRRSRPATGLCIEAHRGCGRCDNCLVGKYTACLNYGDRAKGHRATGMTADGGFAEYAVHRRRLAVRLLPPSLSFEDAVLITTAGTGLYGSTSPADTSPGWTWPCSARGRSG